ncbi:TPA: hypothetical protein MFB09_005423 [Klebsiella pneumoniae]|nr:hypothetical protein [Klebsiella pneumoniae]HBW4757228.1 hypothetical protein [Klebsiella pneumoniae]HBW6830775.1 hypothetical protein [Klebsiella pneumoniae]HCL5703026.1 hypothetical protein [Klebsiella pneumoniae]
MNIKEIGDVFHCDCGFSWSRGKNGNHNCANGLREKVRQLAAENVELKQSERELDKTCAEEFGQDWVSEFTETPATDRIVAEAEARGVEKAIAHLEKKFSNIGVQIMNLQWLADSLREGAK